MRILTGTALVLASGILLLVVGLNVWGYLSQGTLVPASATTQDPAANRVVMVFGASGSVGDGLLKAAIEAPGVDRVHVVTRRSSPRIDAGVATGKVHMHLHRDFTDYAALADVLGEVGTVL